MAGSPRFETTTYEGPPAPPRLWSAYPRMMEYLDGLPAGLHSYPECQARSGILQTFLEDGPALDPGLDPFVRQLLQPPARGFFSEVVMGAAFLALADAAGMSEAQYRAWHRSVNARMFQGLIFRALMAVFSPRVLLERAPSRWEAFHNGSALTVRPEGAAQCVGELTYPARLFTRLHLVGIGESFAAAFEQARGREVRVELSAHGDTSASFLASWA